VYVVTAFKLPFAVALIAITSALGYLFGWVAAAIWNDLHTEKMTAAVPVVRHAA